MAATKLLLTEPLLDAPSRGRNCCLFVGLLAGLCFALLLVSAQPVVNSSQEPANVAVVTPQRQPQLRNRLQYSAPVATRQGEKSRRALLAGLGAAMAASRAQAEDEAKPASPTKSPLVAKLLEKSSQNKAANDATRSAESKKNAMSTVVTERKSKEVGNSFVKTFIEGGQKGDMRD
eukprot:gnl/TRDRNA2_/TRDRNA2_163326_c0_seq2.p1 gnl/TRDRNA2_/TRDRNA2_163326_c0~~gnl/TRDRNA2_/TRDRNA2_163326_c0_seq2.p1  ORF type:complete len:176 (+),score=28.09 gnl/TRDRNA2_/TRDRNA2_163326_c0_seq2:90-617(+)